MLENMKWLRMGFCTAPHIWAPVSESLIFNMMKLWALILCCSGTVLRDAPLALKLARNMVRSGEDSAMVPPQRQRKTNSGNKGKKKKKGETSRCFVATITVSVRLCVCVNLYSGALY